LIVKTTMKLRTEPLFIAAHFFIILACAIPLAAQLQRGIGGVVESGRPAEGRTALVIGNGAYASSPLRNPVNDARLMAGALRAAGFDVILRENADKAQMKAAISEFGRKIKNGGVGLFYFSGHGVQVQDRNFLIPVGANIEYEQHVELEALDAGYISAEMENAHNRLNVVILDACRNSPFARSFRSASRGLAQMTAPRGTLVAYSTAPGMVALDGEGTNSPYTLALAASLKEPGLELMSVFKTVRSNVRIKTGNKQIPWESSSVEGDFYFTPAVVTAAAIPSGPVRNGVTLDGYAVEADAAAAAKAKWFSWQSDMDSAYLRAQNLDQNPDLGADKKAHMWKDFVSGFSDENPFSNEDGAMRWYAEQRMKHWGEYDPFPTGPEGAKTGPSEIEFVFIKGGTFQMGDVKGDGEYDDEKPVHSVTLSDFYIGKTEVTVAQYRAFCSATGRSMPPAPSWGWRENHPVVNVSWNDAMAFCGWAGCRLPTEAEWEYAARECGKNARFGNGKDLADPSGINFDGRQEHQKPYSTAGSSRGQTAPAGSFAPNALGLFDMSGNAAEWCSDWYGDSYYSASSILNPQGPGSGSSRVLRGGSWTSGPRTARCPYRLGNNPDFRYDYYGFRVAR
jgi:formylglycine-generating enzyme required for sulfatase activity